MINFKYQSCLLNGFRYVGYGLKCHKTWSNSHCAQGEAFVILKFDVWLQYFVAFKFKFLGLAADFK
jgi:hypothetical protein